MFNHEDVWYAIETLARRQGWSLSRLAVKAGLDPTALNRSKRVGIGGKPRWPSTETVNRLLEATGVSLAEFCAAVERGTTSDSASGSAGIVLLVDDDADFLEFASGVLRQAGYRVHAAAKHRAALDLITAGEPLDLLCTDIVMPEGLGGIALARFARAHRPGIAVLYVTGYDITGLSSADVHVLRKPASAEALAERITQILGERAASLPGQVQRRA